MTDARGALVLLREAADDGTIDEICERLGVEVLGAFGSAAQPGEVEPGDLDVAVRFRGTASPAPVLALLDALTALTGYDHIDLAVLEGENPVLDAEGLCGVALYECAPGRFAERQMAALGIRRDTAWLRRLDLDRLARGATRA